MMTNETLRPGMKVVIFGEVATVLGRRGTTIPADAKTVRVKFEDGEIADITATHVRRNA